MNFRLPTSYDFRFLLMHSIEVRGAYFVTAHLGI
jgi:hypothetical protein